MDHLAGLDVSVKEARICIVDGAGNIPTYMPIWPYASATYGPYDDINPPATARR